jgi:uncharacterized protein with ParB-like and HNH nuclease domain
MAIINPTTKSLRDLIRDRYYKVPLYQRPYDWDIDKVSVLWDDINKNDPGYFLGFVLFRPEDPKDPHPVEFEVVDGQQRLATLLLLLRAAIETLEQISAEEASEFQKEYIAQRPAGFKESRLTLILSKRDKDKFESLLRGETFASGKKLSSWKNLDEAMKFFKEKFDSLKEDKGKDGIVNLLNEKILKLSFLDVLLGTDSDVYQFFETLNDRGMDLSIADLVKNRVCGEATKQGVSVEDSALTIDRISEELGSGKLKTFLLHYCWANVEEEEPPPRKKLMEWYGKRISQDRNVQSFLNHLEKFALQYYVNFVQPSKCVDARKKEAFTYIDALGATRCYPLLMMGEESLKRKDFLKLCRAIEILEVFRKQPAMRANEQFKLDFAEFEPATHKAARYTLLKLEDYTTGKKQAPLDWDRVTLEHILAEKLDWEGRDEYLERLGNFTLLSSEMNEDAANKPFKDKRKDVYKTEKRIQITKDLLTYRSFTKNTIISRQEEFAKKSVKIWSSRNIT